MSCLREATSAFVTGTRQAFHLSSCNVLLIWSPRKQIYIILLFFTENQINVLNILNSTGTVVGKRNAKIKQKACVRCKYWSISVSEGGGGFRTDIYVYPCTIFLSWASASRKITPTSVFRHPEL
jgi:hypothetical protein